MGTKTTVNDKGVVTESVAGDAITFIVDGKQINKTVTAEIDAGVTVGNKPVVIVEAAGNVVTASLPTLTADLVGTQYTFVNADTSNTLTLSGTNPVGLPTSAWELIATGSCIAVVAITSSVGMSWAKMFETGF